MDNKLEVVTAMTKVLDVSNDFLTFFKSYGYVHKIKRDQLTITIAQAREICINNAVDKIFESNLESLSKAESLMAKYNFSGSAKESAEKQYRLYQKRLEHSLEAFIDQFVD